MASHTENDVVPEMVDHRHLQMWREHKKISDGYTVEVEHVATLRRRRWSLQFPFLPTVSTSGTSSLFPLSVLFPLTSSTSLSLTPPRFTLYFLKRRPRSCSSGNDLFILCRLRFSEKSIGF
ncbi:hypothetical protein B9Z55_014643 [Caenorhabditis nigoni]|uniref:Uncharacterized protein n=1 Tax=Caenorhabditis nigoni TaxID=1611254 RepID=A0A2G5U6T6_9PELO|nr:hypothetical protein B9Z55_014643 [Caenorhabditis nigoni]